MALIQLQDNRKTGEETASGRERTALDFAAIRAKLSSSRGQQYWRSLEELAEQPEFVEYMEREFPGQAPRDWTPLSRRDFMKFMGAAMALAGVGGCAFQPEEHIVPYVKTPEDLVPGIPQFYATAMSLAGYAEGVLAESHEGRPTKIEGNPDHPATLGRSNVWLQSSVLNWWDPDRAQTILKLASASSYEAFVGEINGRMNGLRRNRGRGLAILTETINSPTLERQLRLLKQQMPEVRLHSYEPVSRDNVHAGARLAFGTDAQPIYRFYRANVVLSLDCDFLLEEPNRVRHAADWSRRRKVRATQGSGFQTVQMNRLYVAESTPTITGAKSDHRMPMRASEIENLARAIAAQVGVTGVTGGELTGSAARKAAAIVADLQANRGRGLVCAGQHQPPAVHALCHAINQQLGNAGQTVTYVEPVNGVINGTGNQIGSLQNLVAAMKAGQIETLLILSGNPVYNAPADLDFAGAMDKVPLRVQLSMFEDETSALCHWHVPETHYLESWSDARSYDGTVSIVQPLVQPLYPASRSTHEMVGLLLGQPSRSSYDIVRETYLAAAGIRPESRGPGGNDTFDSGQQAMEQDTGDVGGETDTTSEVMPGSGLGGQQGQVGITPGASPGGADSSGTTTAFEKFWQTVIHDGVVPNSAAKPKPVRVKPNLAASLPTAAPRPTGRDDAPTLEVNFRPDPSVWDGRFANNGWLQELPKPLTKLAWDNAALISPVTAERLTLSTGDRVRLTVGTRSVIAPVLLAPGHPLDSVTVHLGYGRARGGHIAVGDVGFNAYELRTASNPWTAQNAQMTRESGRYTLAVTAHHNLVDDGTKRIDKILASTNESNPEIDGEHGRLIIREGTLAEFKDAAKFEEIVPDHHRAGLPMIPTYAAAHNNETIAYRDPKTAKDELEAHQRALNTVRESAGDAGTKHGGAPGAGGETAAGSGHGVTRGEGQGSEGTESPNSGHGEEQGKTQPSLYPPEIDFTKKYRNPDLNNPEYWRDAGHENIARPYGWGMVIDQNSCIGCNACVIGCQAENNIAVTGKDQVNNGRWLHWIRIDTYYKGSLENPDASFQPMLCQHCEKAPCEPVCPVNAAVHSPEGLNEQVYNRCIGTRYCSNNCPYKVRRFNYLQYSEQNTPVIMLGANPDVTVRARGVMEKCTFCIQRLNYAKWQAGKEERLVHDGEMLTACQQACPTNAIVFGDLNDAKSQVRQHKAQPHNYGVLTELNTYPRVTYLAKTTNPNPAVAAIEREENETRPGQGNPEQAQSVPDAGEPLALNDPAQGEAAQVGQKEGTHHG